MMNVLPDKHDGKWSPTHCKCSNDNSHHYSNSKHNASNSPCKDANVLFATVTLKL